MSLFLYDTCYFCMYMVFGNMIVEQQLPIMLPVLFCFLLLNKEIVENRGRCCF